MRLRLFLLLLSFSVLTSACASMSSSTKTSTKDREIQSLPKKKKKKKKRDNSVNQELEIASQNKKKKNSPPPAAQSNSLANSLSSTQTNKQMNALSNPQPNSISQSQAHLTSALHSPTTSPIAETASQNQKPVKMPLSNMAANELKQISQQENPLKKLEEEKTISLNEWNKENQKDLQDAKPIQLADNSSAGLVFDLPITYNKHIQKWIHFFQTNGRHWFEIWLERSYKHMPNIHRQLEDAGLPKDLIYMAMIESGFSAKATSTAAAAGPWQFIPDTGKRFGLNINWWLDERRDFHKSTKAATKYLSQLYKEFGSWYLVAAAYNTGESRVRRLIKKHNTKDFWELVRKDAFVEETQNYIPKMIAAMLIAKAPKLYGFNNLDIQHPVATELFFAPGGLEIDKLADHLGLTRKSLRELNTELVQAYIPNHVRGHYIRIPKGASPLVGSFIAKQ